MESCDDSEGLKVEPINRHCAISKVDRQFVSIVHDSDGTFGKCGESGIIKRHCAESHHVRILQSWALCDTQRKSCKSSKPGARNSL